MKGRKHHAKGGMIEKGDDDATADEKDKPTDHTANDVVGKEAEERKSGGRAKRKSGGKTMAGKVEGEKAKMHLGRKPRASGGKAGSNFSPLSSAKSGTFPSGRKVMSEMEH